MRAASIGFDMVKCAVGSSSGNLRAAGLFIGGVAFGIAVAGGPSKKRRNASSKKELPEQLPASISKSKEDLPARSKGLVVSAGDIDIEDWNPWVEYAPAAVKAALLESGDDPDVLVSNIFRRIFPNHPWPPEEGTILAKKWDRFIQVIGSELGVPVRSRFHVVS